MSQQEKNDMSQYFYRASAADFMKIPGSPVAYWVSEKTLKIYSGFDLLKEHAHPRQGMATTNNELFLRHWFEVERSKSAFGLSPEEGKKSDKKWFPINKGGEFRRWYGNNYFVVNFENNGKAICDYIDGTPGVKVKSNGRVINRDRYFHEGLTWSTISSADFSLRYSPKGSLFETKGAMIFFDDQTETKAVLGLLNTKITSHLLKATSPTVDFHEGPVGRLPILISGLTVNSASRERAEIAVSYAKSDWDAYETSWDFSSHPLLFTSQKNGALGAIYASLRIHWQTMTGEMRRLEEENNRIFIRAYGLQDELTPDIPLEEITLTCNPHYRYGGHRSEEELEALLQCDTLRELVSYAIGCMMGRYSLDTPGLILASQGEAFRDYLAQIPEPSFAPDENAIIPLTDQEWFPDDATNRFRDFVRIAWGEEHLQENLDFVAESLCLHAIKPPSQKSGGEAALDTIRRYLSTQFYKDHLRTYKKRPIYWLFSSGKHKAFECLVYLHRYNESTLAQMRTEYVIPLTTRLGSYVDKLEQDKEASASAAEAKRIEKELSKLYKQQAELNTFDEKLRHYADQRISLNLDDGVKVNYGKFGDLLAEVKQVVGK